MYVFNITNWKYICTRIDFSLVYILCLLWYSIVIKALITCNLVYTIHFLSIPYPCFFLQFIYDYSLLNMRYGMCIIGIHYQKCILFMSNQCFHLSFIRCWIISVELDYPEFFVDCISFFLFTFNITIWKYIWIKMDFFVHILCRLSIYIFQVYPKKSKFVFGLDLLYIPLDFSKFRILNIQKVWVGSDCQCFEFLDSIILCLLWLRH